MNIEEKAIRDLAALMREVGAIRVRVEGLELELGPEPAQPTPELKPEPTPVCACGHDPDTEHSPSGCLLGCSLDVCSTKPERTPE